MAESPVNAPATGPVPGGPQPGPPGEPKRRFEAPTVNRPPDPAFEPDAPPPLPDAGPPFRAQEDGPGLFEVFKNSFLLDSPITAAARMLELSGLPANPDFLLTEDIQRQLLDDVPPEFKGPLRQELAESSLSMEHARLIKENFRTDVAREQMIAQAGGAGLATRILANVSDPVGLGLALATGGVGFLTKAGRLASALRVGAVTGAEAAALEGFVAQTQVTRDSTDVLLSALTGMALGAPIGAFAARGAAPGAVPGGTSPPSAPGVPRIPLAPLQDEFNTAINAAIRRQNADSIIEASKAAGLDSAGAMRAFGITEPLMEAEVARRFNLSVDDDVARSAAATIFGAPIRFDRVGRLGQDPDPLVRDTGRAYGQEGVGVVGHGNVRRSASEVQDLIHVTHLTPWRRLTNPQYTAWLREQGTGALRGQFSLAKRDEFWTKVGEAVARGGDDPSEAVRQAAKRTSQLLARYNQTLRDAKVSGFEDVPVNLRYLPRIWRQESIRALGLRHGDDQMTALVARSFRDAHPDMSEETATILGRAYWRQMTRVSVGMDQGIMHGIRTDDVEFLKGLLRDSGDLDDEAVNAVVASVQQATETANRASRAKRRADIDENTQIRMANGETVRIAELFERNAEKLVTAYSRVMSGHAALAREVNVRSLTDHRDLMNLIRSRGREAGRDSQEVNRNVEQLDQMYRSIIGQSLENDPAGLLSRGARALRAFNFQRIGPAFGIAQLPEFGVALGTVGVRDMLVQMPALRGFLTLAEDGQLSSALGRQIEAMVAPGPERLINTPGLRIEEQGFGFGERPFTRRFEDASEILSRVVGDISGLNSLTIAFQRMATLGMAQKIMGFALGRKMSTAQQRRLTELIPEDMQARVFAQMQEHVKREPSALAPGKYRLLDLNPEAWTDREALDAFTFALYREGRRVIQRNDIGTRHEFFDSTTGKIMTQFRSFMLSAWTKQTLHGIHHRDFQAFVTFQLGMFVAGLSYIAQQSLNIADPEERKKRLAPDEIAKAAFLRSAHSSLAPAMIDQVVRATGEDPLFAYSRASGLASDFIGGVPTVDTVDKLGQLLEVPSAIIRPDQQVTQRDLRNVRSLLPVLGGLIGVRRVFDAVGAGLPEQRDVE